MAENSNVTVMIDLSGKYFALDNGIWFTGKAPNGPWEVANERPKDVEKIPASSPAYNTKYVYVYDNTPEYVYVGYTSGYMGGYVYGPTIVYGTGFYYRPWYGSIYYPRPVTFGFGFGGGYRGGGWFGPPMYRPPFRPPYGGGGFYGRPRPGYGGGNHYGNNNININVNNNHNNIYNNHKGVTSKNIDRSKINIGNSKLNSNNRIDNKKNNNVFADKDGNIFRKDEKKNIWNERDNKTKGWKPAGEDMKDKLPDLNRDQKARDRGNTRENNFNRDVPNRSPAKSAARPSIPITRQATRTPSAPTKQSLGARPAMSKRRG